MACPVKSSQAKLSARSCGAEFQVRTVAQVRAIGFTGPEGVQREARERPRLGARPAARRGALAR